MNAPPPPPAHAPGTPEWAAYQLAHTVKAEHRPAVEALVVLGSHPWPSLHRARGFYATACFSYRWESWEARLVWSILEAIVGTQEREQDDIPF